jgi:RimJ/RimL family protein N-acetyltransferase
MQVIRPLLPIEAEEIEAHFLRLSDADRYLRFAGPAPASVIERYVGQLNWARSIRLGSFQDGRLRGLAELVGNPDGSAELAVTVESECQRHGIASELVRRMLVIARNRGVRQIVSYCLTENQHMRDLIRKFQGEIALDGANAEAHFAPGIATPFSYWQESVEAADGLIGSLAQIWLGRPATAGG